LVNAGIRSGIQTQLDVYVADLVAEGYTVEVHDVSGGDHVSLKDLILTNSTDLVGCVFVGDLAAAWFEHDYWGYEEFPCDLFFMDLDGQWSDGDSDGKYDSHSGGAGDEGPEIFVGRIDASMMSGNEVAITNAYLIKNHSYRSGGYTPTNHALSYTEDDWAGFWDIRTDISGAYPSFDDVPAPATNRDDYVDNRITDVGYEFIQLCCHSWSQGHAFTRGGYAYNTDIKNAPPQAIYYNLFACSSLRFTSSNFLGGSYIYDTGTPSLAVIGSTKTGSMLTFWAFYDRFGANESFGESFRGWFNHIAPYSDYETAWHFGMTVAGDPFLDLDLNDPCPDPETYCVTSPNSVGSGALMAYGGSTSVTANDLTLASTGCPPKQFGLFYTGPDQASIPVGDGIMCVGGSLTRFPALQIENLGIAELTLDLNNLPGGLSIQAGDLLRFSFWYRDPGFGSAGYNFANGLEVTFCP